MNRLLFALLVLVRFASAARAQDHSHHPPPAASAATSAEAAPAEQTTTTPPAHAGHTPAPPPASTTAHSTTAHSTTAHSMGGFVMGAPAEDWATRPAPMLMPMRTMIPGTWALPGGIMVMANLHGILTNPGFSRARDASLGRTHPYLLNDWVMVRGRTESGYLEGLLMLNFEALSFGRSGWVEVGQAGEGLWDAQHQHQLLHQALLAVHLTGASEGPFRATVWGGQGSATIGAPVFMHRASNPSATVPRKHHKGENPHETAPVVGVTLQYHRSILEGSLFNAREPERDESRLYPRPRLPKSFAARFRQQIGDGIEFQISGEKLVDQGSEGDAYQASSSIYGRWVGRFVLDALLDGALDIPVDEHTEPGKHPHGVQRAGLLEIAVRDASLRDVLWTRVEVNDRLERDDRVSKAWWFGSLGYERVVWVDPASVFGIGVFGEGTLVRVPSSVLPDYGNRFGVTTTVGLRGQLMWMNAAAHGTAAHAAHRH